MRVGSATRRDLVGESSSARRFGPGIWAPVLIVQSNEFNSSSIRTVVVAAITSNLKLALRAEMYSVLKAPPDCLANPLSMFLSY